MHPIAAVQSEYSLWTRDPEDLVVAVMRELGVGLVPYSPLGRGALTGTVDVDSLGPKDFRRWLGRLSGAAGVANRSLVTVVEEVAAARGAAPAQVALAWVYAQSERLGVAICAIPGTKRVRWLEQNVAAMDLVLTQDDLDRLDPLAAAVQGAR